jgi:hypothetical protein
MASRELSSPRLCTGTCLAWGPCARAVTGRSWRPATPPSTPRRRHRGGDRPPPPRARRRLLAPGCEVSPDHARARGHPTRAAALPGRILRAPRGRWHGDERGWPASPPAGVATRRGVPGAPPRAPPGLPPARVRRTPCMRSPGRDAQGWGARRPRRRAPTRWPGRRAPCARAPRGSPRRGPHRVRRREAPARGRGGEAEARPRPPPGRRVGPAALGAAPASGPLPRPRAMVGRLLGGWAHRATTRERGGGSAARALAPIAPRNAY